MKLAGEHPTTPNTADEWTAVVGFGVAPSVGMVSQPKRVRKIGLSRFKRHHLLPIGRFPGGDVVPAKLRNFELPFKTPDGKRKNARRMIERVNSKGFVPFSDKKGRLTRVGVEFGYQRPEQLDSMLRIIQKEIHPKAWILD